VVDLTDPDAAATVLRHCHRRRLRVSMLINNAGVGSHTVFATQTRATIQRMIDVNISAATEIVRLFLPHMLRKKSGTIINVSSIAAFEAEPGTSVYAASKAYLQSFTESLAAEVRDSGVYVASVCPGITMTPFLAAAGLDPDKLQAEAQTPQQVVEEALLGMSKRQELIVTGRSNRMRITAQSLSVRRVISFLRQSLRRIGGR
jgi:short-subunit dehydrogenase